MKKLIIFAFLSLLVAGSARAQALDLAFFTYNGFIPSVAINDRSATLQANLYPKMYQDRSVRRDMQWVSRNDSALVEFWTSKGDTVLHVLRELSGIEWYETEFDIYLVRYFPTLGSSDPLIVPVGGMGDGSVFEAAPRGNRMELALIFQLARRMLAQTNQPENSVRLGISYHPLMRPSAYRLDNLAMLLAVATCQNVIGRDSAYDAYRSAFWVNHHPGRRIFEEYLSGTWIITPDRPLADWLAAESYGSKLVRVTRPPRRNTSSGTGVFIEGVPLRGQLGFAVGFDANNQMAVQNIDQYRLAYACGLREGDVIHRVEGRRMRTHKALVEELLAGLEGEGAAVEIIREGDSQLLLFQSMEFFPEDEYFFPFDEEPYDSLYIDDESE